MDIQALGSSATQLPDGVRDNCTGDLQAVPVGVFPGRERVEQDEFEIGSHPAAAAGVNE